MRFFLVTLSIHYAQWSNIRNTLFYTNKIIQVYLNTLLRCAPFWCLGSKQALTHLNMKVIHRLGDSHE